VSPDGEERERGRSLSDTAMVGIAVTAIVVVVFAGVLTGYLVGHNGRSAASSSAPATTSAPAVPQDVAFGAHAFVQFACAQCHGMRGAGGVSPDVPALQSIAQALTVEQLSSIIEHGAGVSTNPEKPFMPVWHGIVSKHQISALVAYMKAGFPVVAGADALTVPTNQGDAVAGAVLYQRYGCINCHGPNGLGGVPNPQSPDLTVPPLSGADFHGEFDTPKKIADVIRSGSVIGRAPIVSMPHWGTILTDRQIQQLIAYIDTFS